MKKTNPLVRILLGVSLMMLVASCLRYIEGNLVIDFKFYLRTVLPFIILIGLYIKEFKPKNNFLTALKDSYPYFISLYLFSFYTWVPMLLGVLLMLWDFGGDG